MNRAALALVAGAIFGVGLAVSGMADPQRVRSFLDLFGAWDPTLAFVMGGAMLPMAAAWLIQRRLDKPFADAQFSLPATKAIDLPLAAGAVLFGMGWGVAGLCPGPALANLGLAPLTVLPFVIAMFVGMAVHRFMPPQAVRKG